MVDFGTLTGVPETIESGVPEDSSVRKKVVGETFSNVINKYNSQMFSLGSNFQEVFLIFVLELKQKQESDSEGQLM